MNNFRTGLVKNSKNGNAVVELVMVMGLLILFSVSMYQIIDAGALTEARIIERKKALEEARIAMSYINVKIRQNDIRDKIDFLEDKIIIADDESDVPFVTWIYVSDGKLIECIIDPDETPKDIAGVVIAEIQDLKFTYDKEKNYVTSKITYDSGYRESKVKTMESVISLRSHN